jgi:hypothetical protein
MWQTRYLTNTYNSTQIYFSYVYIRLKVQRDAHKFVCILYFTKLALHVSGAIYTHHQEHKLQSTAVGTRDCYGM